MSKLLSFALVRGKSDYCVFRLICLDRKRVRLIVGLYVDDLIVATEAEYCWKLRAHLEQFYPTKNLGALTYFAACICTSEYIYGTLQITQTAYIDRLVDQFDVSRSGFTPESTSVSIRPRAIDKERFEGSYGEVVEGLLWIASSTLPDIANVVCEVVRQAHDPRD